MLDSKPFDLETLGTREICSPLDSTSVLTEAPKQHDEPYHQKLPISFISPKDWQKYLHFTNSKMHDKNNGGSNHGKNGRILRLLNSFHKLYEEYSNLCSKYLQDRVIKTNKKHQNLKRKPLTGLTKNNQSGDNQWVDLSLKDSQISVMVQTTLSLVDEYFELKFKRKKLNTLNYVKNHYNITLPFEIKDLFTPAKKLKNQIMRLTHNRSNDNLCHKNYFDKLLQIDSNINMTIIEEIEKQDVIYHKIALNTINIDKFSLPTQKSIQIPLAIELLLPKIQIKIEAILNECPFLCDPLEVAAELRQFNYNEHECIKHFQNTKLLRSIIEEMMPINGINNEIQLNSTSSTGFSTHSKAAIIDDKSENSNETITAINSINNTNVNNHSKNTQSNISVDRIFTAVKDLCTCNENALIKRSTLLKNSSIDCITQTSRVQFYMDNKYFERYFRLIRNHLSTIRQLHDDTREDVNYLNRQLCCVFSSLKSYMTLLVNQNNDSNLCDDQNGKMLTLSKQVEELKLKLKEEEKRRRKIYNELQEQMGNIRVYCRCRHIDNDINILDIVGNDAVVLPISGVNERFEFDKVFNPQMSQKDVYEEFKPLIMSFIDGYNVCFITYGGEASGKTYTLIGGNPESNQEGLMHRALSTILLEERLRQRDWNYKVTACLIEIYNDNCIDVLAGESNIHLYVESGMETAYQKLRSVPITNEADVDALMQVCRVKRKIAKTALNPTSSRSHLITLIRLQGRSRIHGENFCSFLCLCDLAGFEDIIKAETQTNKILSKEAGYINRSLTAFNRVFVSLKKQDPNTVSYRDTKLTHLLKPFLINSGKCALIVTIRDDKRSIGSTQNTLRFGRESRGVSLGKARRQVNMNTNSSNSITTTNTINSTTAVTNNPNQVLV